MLGVLTLILLAAFPYFEQTRNANELPRLVQAMSLVESGEWAIDGPSRRGLALGPDIARSPVDGRAYPNKPPGASVVGAAAYVVARVGGAEPPTLRELTWWARLFAGVVPVLVIAALAWGRLRQAYGPWVGALAIGLVVFGTPLFSYARLFYGHALAAALLYAGVVTVERGQAQGRASVVALGGLVAASAIAVEYGAAFAGLPIAAMLVWPVVASAGTDQRRAAAKLALAGLLGALVPVSLLAAYQRAVFGSALATGYHHAADPGFAALHGQGLLGLGAPRWANVETHLLSPSTGLLMLSPVVVVAVLGLVRLSRHAGQLQRPARVQLGVFAVIVVMGLGLSFQGGWRVGPRYLVVALPMLILGLADFIAYWRDHPRLAAAAAVLGVVTAAASWSLITNTLAATLWPHIDPTNISEPLGALLVPLWEHGYGPYGLPSWTRWGLHLSLVVPILLGLGGLLYVGGRRRPEVVLIPMLVGAGLGALVPTIIIPGVVVAHPKTEANLHYIERVYEPRVHEGVRVPGPTKTLEPLEPSP